MEDVEAKRAANLAAKEAERKAKVEAIKAEKAAKQAEREKAGNAKEAAEAEKQKKIDEANKKRAANIAAKEEMRKSQDAAAASKPKQQSSKYSKTDVLNLKKAFDECTCLMDRTGLFVVRASRTLSACFVRLADDMDGSGEMDLTEWKNRLKAEKEAKKPRPGQASTLQERQAAKGISLADLPESVFDQMDKDKDGRVCRLCTSHVTNHSHVQIAVARGRPMARHS